jgi:hypothetical protein
MIERSDWSNGEPTAIVTPDNLGAQVVPASPNKGSAIHRPDWPLPAESASSGNVYGQAVVDAVERKWNQNNGQEVAADSQGLPSIVRQELERSADGHDAALGVLQQAAANILGEVKNS